MNIWDFLPDIGPINSFVKYVFCDTVIPRKGSILRCSLALDVADHTGIYLGKGRIAELDGDGHICEISPDGFLNSSRVRTGLYIYVACDGETEEPLCSEMAAFRAKQKLGTQTEYNLVLNNCHEFVSGCITGNFSNSDTALWMLEMTIANTLNNGNSICWRAWDR